MDLMTGLIDRKSVRTYTGAAVTPAQQAALLQAAYASPVAMGDYSQLTLTVVTNQALLAAIEQATGSRGMLYGAPMFILVSTKLAGNASDNSAYSNAATIVQNLNLAAVALGLGGCHIWGAVAAFAQNTTLKAQLQIPVDQTPVAGFVAGVFEGGYPHREVPTERIKTTILA